MDDRRRDGGTNSTLRIKEQGKHLTLNEHDDDDDDDATAHNAQNKKSNTRSRQERNLQTYMQHLP